MKTFFITLLLTSCGLLLGQNCRLELVGPTLVCKGQQNVTYTANTTGTWYFPRSFTVTQPSTVSFNNVTPGLYYIVFSTSSSQCFSIDSLPVVVAEAPAPPCVLDPITNALRFDGVDDFVKINTYTGINNIGLGDFTLEARIKAKTQQQAALATLLSNRSSTADGFQLFLMPTTDPLKPGKPSIRLSGTIYTCMNCPSLTDDQCHVLSLSRNGGVLRFYVDGVLYETLNANRTATSAGALFIGKDNIAPSTFFNGDISEVRIWNHARPATEISNAAHTTVSMSQQGLVGYWRLNEGYGQTAANAVSYSHSGELGSSWQTDPSDPLWVSSCTGISKKKGSSFENPIELGGIGTATAFTNTQNNSPANNFGDDIGQVSDDIVYSFYLNTTSLVTIHTCGSTVNDTYLSLYRSNRQLVLKNDDNGFGGTLCSDYYKASIKANLSQGTYYVVAEGYSNNHIGNITTHIKVEAPDASTVYRTEGQSAETGVVDKYREQIHPYPNPIQEGLLHFGRQATTYALINSAGTVLLQGVNRENIAVDGLPPGLYILQLDENRQKIVIE